MKTKINWLLVLSLMANLVIFFIGIYLVHTLGGQSDVRKPKNWDKPKSRLDTVTFDDGHTEVFKLDSAD